ncbi:MAG: 2-C-methyl-D-erythritol 4-phosphate cytidylyltransferase [bacterium]
MAAGKGARFGDLRPKQFCLLGGRLLLSWTIERFEECKLIDNIILVVPPAMSKYVKETVISSSRYKKVKAIVEGGKERGDSVFEGLQEVDTTTDIVLIHDGVRPLISCHLIERVIDQVKECKAAVLGIPLRETVKETEGGSVVSKTLNRRKLYSIQTPQGFRRDLILKAYEEAKKEGWWASDDAGLVERLGEKVKIIPGEETNIKITTSLDLKFAEMLLRTSDSR